MSRPCRKPHFVYLVPEAGIEPARAFWTRGILSSDHAQRPFITICADLKQIEKLERESRARPPFQLASPICASGKVRAKQLAPTGSSGREIHGSQETR
jgi:hypothetical protein